MNLPNSSHDEGSSNVNRREYLTVDGEAWDVSNLLNSLPSEDTKKVTPSYGTDTKEEQRKLPASLKKAHNDNLTLKPVPKYDWRSTTERSPSPPKTQEQEDVSPEQQQIKEGRYEDQFYYEDERGQASAASSLHQSDLMNNHSSFSGRNNNNHQSSNGGDFERSLIEVFPGVEMPLRGSVETQHAITRNFIATANCMDCTLQLQCIKDAEYVLCPLCHCVSPMELSCQNVMQGAFGVGLGFCDEEL